MSLLTPAILYDGSTRSPQDATRLMAGPLEMVYTAGTPRYIRLKSTGVEILRQIYAAVRDQNWGTIPGELTTKVMDIQADHFRIEYQNDHRQKDIAFRWTGALSGTADGVVTFQFKGEAGSTFKRNRIGFCILHPMMCAGARCRIEQVDGTVIEGIFPATIAPHQPFKNIRAIQHEVMPDMWAEVRMAGDIFEMEDQRNWTDASYKTYCTPLEIPYPAIVEKGTRIEQTVTLRLLNALPDTPANVTNQTVLTLDTATHRKIPAIGLCTSSQHEPLSENAVARIRQLQLTHLRVDLKLAESGWQTSLQQAVQDAQRIQTPLEIALTLSNNAADELHALSQAVQTLNPPVLRWLIFHQHEKPLSAATVELARQILGGDARIYAGSDTYFTELNRFRPDTQALDGVVYSMNPQVHAFDNASMIETLPASAVTVASAREFCADKPIIVGPITLKIRWNPNATAPELPPAPGELPRQADPRQMSLFGAVWTTGSLKHLMLSQAASLTYFETTGYRGIMATEAGSALPDKFWNIADGVYPMYHVFADVGEFAGGEVVNIVTPDALKMDGLALRKDSKLRILIANYTPETQSLTLNGIGGAFRLRTLDETNAEFAMREPENYRATTTATVAADSEALSLSLRPYALITLDGELA